MNGFYQETATAAGLWRFWGGSQNSPAVGLILLFETLRMELWRAGVIPVVSLWLWWLGSSSKTGCCFLTAGTEQSKRDREEGEGGVCGGRAVMHIPGFASSLLWPPQRLKQVAASSVSLCLTRTEGYCLTICGPFDVLLPGTGKTSTVSWLRLPWS